MWVKGIYNILYNIIYQAAGKPPPQKETTPTNPTWSINHPKINYEVSTKSPLASNNIQNQDFGRNRDIRVSQYPCSRCPIHFKKNLRQFGKTIRKQKKFEIQASNGFRIIAGRKSRFSVLLGRYIIIIIIIVDVI